MKHDDGAANRRSRRRLNLDGQLDGVGKSPPDNTGKERGKARYRVPRGFRAGNVCAMSQNSPLPLAVRGIDA